MCTEALNGRKFFAPHECGLRERRLRKAGYCPEDVGVPSRGALAVGDGEIQFCVDVEVVLFVGFYDGTHLFVKASKPKGTLDVG